MSKADKDIKAMVKADYESILGGLLFHILKSFKTKKEAKTK